MLRCPACRSRRTTYTLMEAHLSGCGQALCSCGGYHFKHRPGSPLCEQNPRAAYNAALRADEPDDVLLEILVDMAWSTPGKQLGKKEMLTGTF